VLSAVDSKFSDANDSELLEEWAIERSYHDEMIEYKTRNFVGRKDTIEAMDKHIHGRENTPLAVAGDPGSGKSALMAYFVRHAIANGSARLSVVSHFVGASAASTNPRFVTS
jgi:polynucleotide 5'-kinase involved in rRNA processing